MAERKQFFFAKKEPKNSCHTALAAAHRVR
jgi:hypothetical protein